ncbi:hypothetical protein [Shouchella clausii]|uniref:hypothetical protein n=1 Tax=Shouchella clausii TaxID=79880 RepID=UPI00115513AE|nr:hypothetical protein [Shouchella clausii]MBX0319738.1 hypothetical protein [Shouchella clausii]
MGLKKIYRRHFLGFELLLSIIITFSFFLIVKHTVSFNLLFENLIGIRDVLYGTLAALSGALLGFVITGLSVLLISSDNEQMKRFKKSKHSKTIFKVFFSTSKYLGILLLISLVSLIFDRDNNESIFLMIGSFWGIVIVTLRILRCIWVLERIVSLHTEDTGQ